MPLHSTLWLRAIQLSQPSAPWAGDFAPIAHLALKKRGRTRTRKSSIRIRRFYHRWCVQPWQDFEAARAHAVFVGEWGCWNRTPHSGGASPGCATFSASGNRPDGVWAFVDASAALMCRILMTTSRPRDRRALRKLARHKLDSHDAGTAHCAVLAPAWLIVSSSGRSLPRANSSP